MKLYLPLAVTISVVLMPTTARGGDATLCERGVAHYLGMFPPGPNSPPIDGGIVLKLCKAAPSDDDANCYLSAPNTDVAARCGNLTWFKRRAECATVLDLVAAAERAYKSTNGRYVAAAPYPPAPSTQPVAWSPTDSGWLSLTLALPDGVRGTYSVRADAATFRARCEIDADGDGVRAVFETSDSTPTTIDFATMYYY